MQELLTNMYANASGPLISALFLGLLMSIAPCPLTLNITAIGFIGKNISERKYSLTVYIIRWEQLFPILDWP